MLTRRQMRAKKASARKSLGKIASGEKPAGHNRLNRIARLTHTPVRTIRSLLKEEKSDT
jgi:hypothetical protein